MVTSADQPELTIAYAYVTSAEMETPSVALTSDGSARRKWAMRDSNPRHRACESATPDSTSPFTWTVYEAPD